MKARTDFVYIYIFTLVQIIFFVPNLCAQVNISFDQSEIVLRIETKLDWIGEDCGPVDCNENSGFRVDDFSVRYNYFTSLDSLVFADINIDLSDVGRDEFLTSFSTYQKYPDSNTIDSIFIGSQIENLTISIGKQIPNTTGFNSTSNSHIGLNLSAFSDDRFLISSGKADNIVMKVDWSDRYRYVISLGVSENKNLIPDLKYEALIDVPLSESGDLYFSAAIKSIKIDGADDFAATGLKLSWFCNNGNLFEFAYSENGIGEYTEFLFKRDWSYRHRLEFGISDFEENQRERLQEIASISDSRFMYLNYQFSISRTLQWFIERSDFQSDDFDRKVMLSGFEFSF